MTGTVRKVTAGDLDWIAARLAERRAALVPYAPVYWRPAVDATAIHRRFLGRSLREGRAVGFRTDHAVLIAASGRDGWTIDDAVVPDDDWSAAGRVLWDEVAAGISGSRVRFVCPVPEPGRRDFACALGLRLSTSWWHLALAETGPPAGTGTVPRVEGARAVLVPAPPVYDPGGPVLLVTGMTSAACLPAAEAQARLLGSPVVVVDQPPSARGVAAALEAAGYRRHCDFFTGTAVLPAS